MGESLTGIVRKVTVRQRHHLSHFRTLVFGLPGRRPQIGKGPESKESGCDFDPQGRIEKLTFLQLYFTEP